MYWTPGTSYHRDTLVMRQKKSASQVAKRFFKRM